MVQCDTNDIGHDNEHLLNDRSNFLAFRFLQSPHILADLMQHSLILGAEKLLMANQKSPGLSGYFDFEYDNGCKNRIIEGEYASMYEEKESSAIHFYQETESNYVNGVFKMDPLNIIDILSMLWIKFTGFQITIFLWFFTLPFGILNFWLMLLVLPIRMLTRISKHFEKMLRRTCMAFYLGLISFICYRIKAQKSVLKLAIRFGKAFFCTINVFLVLLGLLVSGFVVASFVLRNFVEESVHTTEILNFDYTKTSPVAVVPLGNQMPIFSQLSNHKLKLTISFTLPESDYNRQLGIFQVRVEGLSANGKTMVASSYPAMLRFKSQPVRIVETLFKTAPIITGFQSEVQNLKIVIEDFTQGYQPTPFLKVILQQRAGFEAGSGVPQIYDASLDIESELPWLKRMMWNWRRTMFVWISFTSFMFEVMAVLVFCKPASLTGS
ncbi:seipin-3-like [Primulina huaijiensis]|uniref:seipin-3-like n=1 Tax=Primulina huaijiensis TaxID=1492673 RepID=UPI003CC76924